MTSSPTILDDRASGVGMRAWLLVAALSTTFGLSACGTIQSSNATEQLLASDAVDTAIARIDFSPLEGQKVFFETRYIQNLKVIGFVSAEYIISSLRQSMTASGLLLQDSAAQADYVVEARVGTLGADSHDIVYGLPASNGLSAASTAVATVSQATPPLPAIPELSLAKKKNQFAAAKVACFAYHRESRERVWQSGLSTAKSTAKDTWFLGAGPFQKGTIYNRTGIAGSSIDVGDKRLGPPSVAFREEIVFEKAPKKVDQEPEVVPAGGEKAAAK
jgi:hypothetical protein